MCKHFYTSITEAVELPTNIQLENTNLKSWERKVMEWRNARTGEESKCSARQSEEERSEEHLQNVAFPSLDHSSISVFSHYVLITATSRQLTKACVYFLSFNLWMSACGCLTVCLRVFYYCIQGKEAVSKFPSSSSSSSFSSSFFGAAISWTKARKLCVGQLGWEAQRIVGRAKDGRGRLYIDTSLLMLVAKPWRKREKGRKAKDDREINSKEKHDEKQVS